MTEPVDLSSKLAAKAHIFSRGPFGKPSLLTRFLQFVLDHEGEELTEEVIRCALYPNEATAKRHSQDNRVRQVARSVRRNLERYYTGDGAEQPVAIMLERYTYRPVFEWRFSRPVPLPPSPAPAATDVPTESQPSLDRSVCEEYISRQKVEFRKVLTAAIADHELFGNPMPDKPVPFLCTVLQIRKSAGAVENVLLVPSAQGVDDIEGGGRTSIALRCLGISLPYADIMATDTEHLPTTIDVSFSRGVRHCSLVASDMGYISLEAESGDRAPNSDDPSSHSGLRNLCVSPTPGERLDFVWDIARHLFRCTTLGFRSGHHRNRRQRLLDLFYRIPFAPLKDVFASAQPPYRVDRIIVLQPRLNQRDRPAWFPLGGEQEARATVRTAFLAGAAHKSPFWLQRSSALRVAAEHVFGSGGLAAPDWCLPQVDVVEMPARDSGCSHYVFDEICEYILNPEGARRTLRPSHLAVERGVRYFNGALIAALRDQQTGGSLEILLSSGESLVPDVAFWDAVRLASGGVRITLLFLDPNSPEGRKWNKLEAPGSRPEPLTHQVNRNIRLARQVASKIGADLTCGLYRSQPNFKLAMFGTKALVGSYADLVNSSTEMAFFEVDDHEGGGLYRAFRYEFERLLAESKDRRFKR